MFTQKAIDFSINVSDFKSLIALSLGLVCFTAYWFISVSAKIKKKYYEKFDSETAAYRHIFFTKFAGFFLMGVVPFLVFKIFLPDVSLSYFGLSFNKETALFSVFWTCALTILVVPMAYFSAKNPKNFVNYPQIRTKLWDRKIFYLNLLGWAIYLFGYEFLFRGILLVPLSETLGIWPAIGINVAMYSATHIPKGLDETIGAVPLGIVLCILTLLSGTIWIAFLVHVALAWTNSLTALRFHPEIHFIPWKKD
ncbi:MAG: hypothetical protein RIT43_1293 [Bacteroidota bacterium]|jgi:membrane protease YdiL (CAAX protease family)